MPVRISPQTPNLVSERPETDPLSDVLRSLHLRVGIFKHGRYRGRWALDSTGVTRATFHLIGRGQAWVHRDGASAPLAVHSGDLVMFPHAHWHQLSGTPKRERGTRLEGANDGPFTTVLCAMVECDTRLNPLMQALPDVIVVRSEDHTASATLQTLARLMLAEYEAGAAGGQAVLDRYAEVMFVSILRHHMQHASGLTGLLAALKDARIARALSALHRDPAKPWRVATLAREARMSRSAFADRFSTLLGASPIAYLTAWRMQLANEILARRDRSIAAVAEQLGYGAENAFRRAFKRVRGVGPGNVRRGIHRADSQTARATPPATGQEIEGRKRRKRVGIV